MPSTKRVKLPAWGSVASAWIREADLYRAMDEEVVRNAAVKAAVVLKTACQDIIFSEGDLDEYSAVAERTTVWSDDENVYVGIPGGDPVKSQADEMNEAVFPVIEAAFDMAGAQAVDQFESELRFS